MADRGAHSKQRRFGRQPRRGRGRTRQLDRVLAIAESDRRAHETSPLLRCWAKNGTTVAVNAACEVMLFTDPEYPVIDDLPGLVDALFAAREYCDQVAIATVHGVRSS